MWSCGAVWLFMFCPSDVFALHGLYHKACSDYYVSIESAVSPRTITSTSAAASKKPSWHIVSSPSCAAQSSSSKCNNRMNNCNSRSNTYDSNSRRYNNRTSSYNRLRNSPLESGMTCSDTWTNCETKRNISHAPALLPLSTSQQQLEVVLGSSAASAVHSKRSSPSRVDAIRRCVGAASLLVSRSTSHSLG